MTVKLSARMIVSCISAAMACGLAVSTASAQTKVVIIVNSENPLTEVSKEYIADIYLKRIRHWPDGAPIRFFDQQDGSENKTSFLRSYIGKTPREVDTFWIGQKLFTGDSAPQQVPSDAMALMLVRRFKEAISYVSSEIPSSTQVKVLKTPSAP